MILRSLQNFQLTEFTYSLDTETTGTNPRRDTVVGFSFCSGGSSYYVVHKEWNGNQLVEVIRFADCVAFLQQLASRQLIFHNAAFDIQIIKNYFGVELEAYFDTMLAAHTCDENLFSYGLKDLAAQLFGQESKDDQAALKAHLKAKGAGTNFYMADTTILGTYAIKDAKLTYDLFEHLRDKLEFDGLEELFYTEIMPLYNLVVIPMQARGVAVDIDYLRSSLVEITADMQVLKAEILQEIAPQLKPFYDKYYAKHYPLKSRGKVFDAMKGGRSLRAAQEFVAAQVGDEGFNILSKNHLAELFCEIMSIEPLEKTPTGRPKVDEDFLDHVADQHPWTRNLVLYNKLTKLKGTYIERILEEQENGVFYPDWFLHRTTSGRMSGDAQQLPRPIEPGDAHKYHPTFIKYVNRIREFFISRPGMMFADTDYNSLEPRCFASNAGDEALFNIFRLGHDFYSSIGIPILKLEGVSPDKSADNYLGKVDKSKRQFIKPVALGVPYGMDDYKLHKDLNISQDEAKTIIKNYMTSFPKLASRMEECRRSMLINGTVSTRFGRVRRQPEIPELYKQHGDSILNALELWKKLHENDYYYKLAKKDYKIVRHALNNSLNFPIQGLAAHILNRSAIAIVREFKRLGINAYIVACIHDQIIVEFEEGMQDVVGPIIQRCMETTVEIEAGLEAIPAFGHNFREAH